MIHPYVQSYLCQHGTAAMLSPSSELQSSVRSSIFSYILPNLQLLDKHRAYEWMEQEKIMMQAVVWDVSMNVLILLPWKFVSIRIHCYMNWSSPRDGHCSQWRSQLFTSCRERAFDTQKETTLSVSQTKRTLNSETWLPRHLLKVIMLFLTGIPLSVCGHSAQCNYCPGNSHMLLHNMQW